MPRKIKKYFVQNTKANDFKPNTRKRVRCDCNLCKGANVDSRTRELHMKERQFETRSFIETSTNRRDKSSIKLPDDPIDLMDIDEIGNISNDVSESKHEFNFLVKDPKKSKGKQKRGISLVVIDKFLSDSDDRDEDTDETDSEKDDLEQTVNFDAPESGYEDKDTNIPITNINQSFTWIVYWILKFQER